MTTGQSHVVDSHSRYLASCGLGAKLRIASERALGDNPTANVPVALSPAPSLGTRDRRLAEKAEQKILDICARVETPQGFITDFAEDLVAPLYAVPLVLEDPELLKLLEQSHPLRCAIIGAAYKLRDEKVQMNAGDFINSAVVILKNAGLENRALKVMKLIEKIFPQAVAQAPAPSR